MSVETNNLTPDLLTYWQKFGFKESKILQELRQYAEKTIPNARMQIAPEQASFLQFLIKANNIKNILEIGTFAGYSALAMALALPENAKLITCDIDDSNLKLATDFWKKANVSSKISANITSGLQIMTNCKNNNKKFDLIFIDADKQNYLNYYQNAINLLNPNGIIAIDNVLWHGKVAENKKDNTTEIIDKLNQTIYEDDRVDFFMLPLADGLTLIRKNIF